MLINTPLSNAHRLLSPRIAYIITTVDRRGKANAAPISNLTSASTEPQAVILAIYPEWTTFANIKTSKQFVINLPKEELLEKVWICGNKYAGIPIPSEVNKLSLAGFTELASEIVQPPKLLECYAHLECQVIWIKEAGNHMLILAEVVAASHDEQAFSDQTLLNVNSFKPVMQISGPYFTSPDKNLRIDEEKVRSYVQKKISATNKSQ